MSLIARQSCPGSDTLQVVFCHGRALCIVSAEIASTTSKTWCSRAMTPVRGTGARASVTPHRSVIIASSSSMRTKSSTRSTTRCSGAVLRWGRVTMPRPRNSMRPAMRGRRHHGQGLAAGKHIDPVVGDEERALPAPLPAIEQGQGQNRLAGAGRPAQQDARLPQHQPGAVDVFRLAHGAQSICAPAATQPRTRRPSGRRGYGP